MVPHKVPARPFTTNSRLLRLHEKVSFDFFDTSRSMNDLVARLTPVAPVRYHLAAAALLWTIVGSALLYFGVKWVVITHEPIYFWLLAPSLAVGILKTHLVLFRAADRATTRIILRGDRKCIGGFLSAKTWVLVAFMITGGRLLRAFVLPLGVSGLLYAAVGIALAYGSIRLWKTWFAFVSSNSSEPATAD